MEDDTELRLRKELTPVRKRLTLFTLCRYLMLGTLFGSIGAVLLLTTSRLLPIVNAGWLSAMLAAVGSIAGLGIGMSKFATVRDAARTMDRDDTQDAIGTALDGFSSGIGTGNGTSEDAWSGTNKVSPIVRMQREAAIEAAARYTAQLRERLPWPAWQRWRSMVYGLAAAMAAAAMLLVWPNPMQDKAEALAAAMQQLKEMEEEAEQISSKIQQAELPKEAELALLQPLEELRSQLKASGSDPLEAMEGLEEALQKLEQTAEAAKQSAERLSEAAAAMNSEPSLRKLGQSLQDGDTAGMKDAVSELREDLTKLTPEQREAMAKALEKLAAEQPEQSKELAEALQQAAQQAREAGSSGAAGAGAGGSGEGDGLDALQSALASELTAGDLEALARSMSGQLAQAGQALAEQLAAQGLAVPPSVAGGTAGPSGAAGAAGAAGQPGAPGGAAGASPGPAGTGQSPGAGQGAGSGQGTGAGAGSGAGQGAGTGSGRGAGQGTGTGSGSGGQGAGLGAGSRSMVTTPRSMQGSGNVQQDGGPSTGGQIQYGGKSPMIDGTTRPYDEVFSEYNAEAKQALSRSQLPESMQERVKEYFEEIQPNR
ncbi:hypothetical protein ACFO9Q_00100 [Paenibacillus sp. GCM10023252]|uniref:hypothetical protein n=1 Tax=Paenibacillus sp. GCM10023252 TaxID=3252649 RepID=UPI0036125FB6